MQSKRHPTSPSRPTNLASTAGAFIALVAIAAMTAGPAARTAPMEIRSTLNEAQTVRAVAAAVVAAARELVGQDRIDVDLPVRHARADAMMQIPLVAPIIHPDDQPSLALRTIGERLLDLPPPAC